MSTSLIEKLEKCSPKGTFTHPENKGYAAGYLDAFDIVRQHESQHPTFGVVHNGAFQGVLQEHNDDCVRACVASLFGLPLGAVPRFAPETWGDELERWLHERGLAFINVSFTGEQKDGVPRGLTIGAIPSRSDADGWMHSVVCLDGRVIWDPKYGPQPGTERANEYTVIYSLRNPALPASLAEEMHELLTLIASYPDANVISDAHYVVRKQARALLAKLPAPPAAHSGLGYCPTCGAAGVRREKRPDGNDRCQAGHTYPSREAVMTKAEQRP